VIHLRNIASIIVGINITSVPRRDSSSFITAICMTQRRIKQLCCATVNSAISVSCGRILRDDAFSGTRAHRPCRVGASVRATPAEWCYEWVVRTCSAVCDVPRRHAKATVNNVSIHYLHPAQYWRIVPYGVHPRAESIRTLYAPILVLPIPLRAFFYFTGSI